MPTKKRTIKQRSSKKLPDGDIASSQALITEGVTDTEMIIVVLLLVFLYPVGVLCMWIMMKTWPVWVKLLISLPILFLLCFIMLILFFMNLERRYQFEPRYYMHQRMIQMYPKTTLNTFQPSVFSSQFSHAS